MGGRGGGGGIPRLTPARHRAAAQFLLSQLNVTPAARRQAEQHIQAARRGEAAQRAESKREANRGTRSR